MSKPVAATWAKMLHGAALAIVLAAFGDVVGAADALAQEAAPDAAAQAEPAAPSDGEAAPTRLFPILVIRQASLFSESLAARSIANQAAAAESALDAELDTIGESLRNRERELSDQRATLPKAEFDALATEFERDVRAFYARSQRERGLVDQAVSRARSELRRGAQAVLIEIMRRHGALVMLDEEQVVLSVQVLDVTQEAIDRLNQSVPDITLELPKSEAPSQP